MPDIQLSHIITALFILAALLLIVKSVVLPNAFYSRERERNELRRRIIKNEILRQEIATIEKPKPE